MRKVKLCMTLLLLVYNLLACNQAPDSPIVITSETQQVTPIPTFHLIDGWLAYRNATYNYEFSYPPETTIQVSGADGFPPEELPAGMTAEEYLLQLQDKYGDLCVIATYGEGFLLIQAPPGRDYVLCGGFGVGADVVIEKSELVGINGKIYPSRGWELYKQEGDNTILYSEFFFLDIEDGTHFAYGANLESAPEKFDDYLTVKEILLRMLASYRTIE